MVSGPAVAALGAGAVLAYASFHGVSVLASVRAVVAGKAPPTAGTEPITGGPGIPPVTVTGTSPQAALQQAAAARGWDTGAQWQALNAVEMAEAGYNPAAVNPKSGALGMAQALGHGTAATAGTLGNEYGGFGLTTEQAVAANSGSAQWQCVWMCNYIASVYGSPAAAWAHEQTYRWY